MHVTVAKSTVGWMSPLTTLTLPLSVSVLSLPLFPPRPLTAKKPHCSRRRFTQSARRLAAGALVLSRRRWLACQHEQQAFTHQLRPAPRSAQRRFINTLTRNHKGEDHCRSSSRRHARSSRRRRRTLARHKAALTHTKKTLTHHLSTRHTPSHHTRRRHARSSRRRRRTLARHKAALTHTKKTLTHNLSTRHTPSHHTRRRHARSRHHTKHALLNHQSLTLTRTHR